MRAARKESDLKTVALVGYTNVGKSTLLNALAGSERAIVTSVAGTTRDVLEETVRVGNITLRLADTAGIRENTDDIIEKIGVERAKERFERAGLVFMVLDGGEKISEDDKELLKLCKEKRSIVIVNKSDLPRTFSVDEIKDYAQQADLISALSGESGFSEKEIGWYSHRALPQCRRHSKLRCYRHWHQQQTLDKIPCVAWC